MKSTYYPQSYRCIECNHEHQHYIWSDEIHQSAPHKHPCPLCGWAILKADMFDKEVSDSFIMIKTPTANRVRQASRKKRNLDHFKKQVYPTMKRGSQEQQHFAKKHKLK